MKRYIVIFSILIGIMFTLDYLQKKNLETVLYDVMSQRIEIIEMAAYGETSYEKAESLLVNITQNPLLLSDLKFLKELNGYPTEIDRVKDFKVSRIKNLCVIENNITFSATVIWTMEGLNGTYFEESSFIFEMKKDKNNYILINYYLIE